MTEAELRRKAEDQLARREARAGRIEHREAWIQAAMRAIRADSREPADSAQTVLQARHEAERRPLPEAATAEQIAASKPWLASMRQALRTR